MIDAAKSIPERRRANKAELAAFFGTSLPTVEAWIRRGCPVVQKGSRGVAWAFDLLQVAQWRFTGQTGQTGSDDEEIDPAKLQPSERKAWFESEIKRRDLQVRDGELIPAESLELCVSTAFAAIAQGMRAIPDHLERRIGCGPDVAEAVGNILDEEMSALADRLTQLAPAALEVAINE